MRIGILTTSGKSLGDTVRTQKFYDCLRDMGYDVTIIDLLSGRETSPAHVTSSPVDQVLSYANRLISSPPLNKMSLLQRLKYNLMIKSRYERGLRAVWKKIDLLQAETHNAAEIALLLKKTLGIPYIFEVHCVTWVEEYKSVQNPSDDFLSYLRKREARMMLNAEEVFAVSNPMKEYLESSFGLGNVTVVPNGSDPYPGLRKTHSIPLNVIFAGAFEYYENVDDYLDAVSMVKSDDFRFYLAGDGNLRENILRRLRNEGLPIKYFGCLPRDALREFMRRVHVGVAPKPNEFSQRFNSSIKTFEYLSMGLPVICARIGEWAQEVERHDCGTTVPLEDPKAIADALCLYRDKELWTRQSNNGIELVKDEYSWNDIIGEVEPIYEKYVR